MKKISVRTKGIDPIAFFVFWVASRASMRINDSYAFAKETSIYLGSSNSQRVGWDVLVYYFWDLKNMALKIGEPSL